MGNSETLLALIPREDGMLIEKMFYEDEIKELPKEYTKTDVNPEELKMAKTLITSMDKPFEPTMYEDEYQERLKEVIEKKVAGQEIVTAAATDDVTPSNVINIMDALKKSIEQNKAPKKKTTTSKKTKGA